MAALPLAVNSLHKSEMEYNRKLGHTLGRIQHIAIMSRIAIFYATCCLETQTVSPIITDFQGIKRCVQYLSNHLHKTIFYSFKPYNVSNFIRLTCSGNKV